MKILQNRKISVIIFVLAVILFTLIGSHRSLTKACQQVENAFFDKGALREDYYTCPAEQLNHCIRYANSILSSVNGQLPDAIYDDICTSRSALIEAMEKRDISDIYIAQCALTRAVENADAQAISAGIQTELDDFVRLISDYRSAAAEAAASGYNDYVYDFMQSTADRFPTNILRHLTLVEMPERYE